MNENSEKLIISSSPHIHTRRTTRGIMGDVLIALVPAAIAAVVYYGPTALMMLAVCIATCVLCEALFNIIVKKKQTVGDLSAIVTGTIFALSLPIPDSTKIEGYNLWMLIWPCIVGSAFAIIVVKCLFGGLGCNFANPAVTARVMVLIAFSSVMGTATGTNLADKADVVASSTPLSALSIGSRELPSLIDMFLGNRGGAIGESCMIALLIGFAYLVVRRVISWYTPVIYVGTVALFCTVYYLISGDSLTLVLYQLMGGGLVYGAVFMATDYVTTPINKLGRCVFAVGCGLLTCLIRFFGSYPEGVSFAILIMNILSPYIEKLTSAKPFGGARK